MEKTEDGDEKQVPLPAHSAFQVRVEFMGGCIAANRWYLSANLGVYHGFLMVAVEHDCPGKRLPFERIY